MLDRLNGSIKAYLTALDPDVLDEEERPGAHDVLLEPVRILLQQIGLVDVVPGRGQERQHPRLPGFPVQRQHPAEGGAGASGDA